MPSLLGAVDPEELAQLHNCFGPAPHRTVRLAVDSPFLDGEHQLLTSDGRRAEICYVLHRGDPQAGVLLHRKVFYPSVAYRLPTGGIHVGEAVVETLVREIEEETSFHLALLEGESAPAGRHTVTLQAFLGTLEYELYHHSQNRIHTFATYHFLIAAPAEAAPEPLDPEEQVAGWEWRSLAEMAQVADVLERVGETAPVWGDWGRFRALSHRFVASGTPGGGSAE